MWTKVKAKISLKLDVKKAPKLPAMKELVTD